MKKQTELYKIEIPIKRVFNESIGDFERSVGDNFFGSLQDIIFDEVTGAIEGTKALGIEQISLNPEVAETPEIAALIEQLKPLLTDIQPILTALIIKRLEWTSTQLVNNSNLIP